MNGRSVLFSDVDKSENLSISVQGLPGLRGPEGPPGKSCARKFVSHFRLFEGLPGPMGPRGLIGPPGK
jgi:hypothetical protein